MGAGLGIDDLRLRRSRKTADDTEPRNANKAVRDCKARDAGAARELCFASAFPRFFESTASVARHGKPAFQAGARDLGDHVMNAHVPTAPREQPRLHGGAIAGAPFGPEDAGVKPLFVVHAAGVVCLAIEREGKGGIQPGPFDAKLTNGNGESARGAIGELVVFGVRIAEPEIERAAVA